VDLLGADVAACERGTDRVRAEVGRGHRAERAGELADRRTGGRDDHGTGHGGPPMVEERSYCPPPECVPCRAPLRCPAMTEIDVKTVWTSIFAPVPTFGFLQRLGRESVWGARHDQPFHVVGSDAAGVVLRVGSAVRLWKPGDAVTVHCHHVDDQDPSAHDDSMLATNQRIWGYETNYGGLGELTVVKANQLMPKPAHLTWEEAAVNALTNSTSYRM